MRPKDDNKLDKHFKAALNSPEDHIAFREEDWAAMEKLLDGKPSKKAVVFRLIWVVSGIAAILLLAFALFFHTGDDTQHRTKVAVNKNTAGILQGHGGVIKHSPAGHQPHVQTDLGIHDTGTASAIAQSTRHKAVSPYSIGSFSTHLAGINKPYGFGGRSLYGSAPHDHQALTKPEMPGNDAATLATDSSAATQLAAVSYGVAVSAQAINEPDHMSDNIKAKFPGLPEKPKSTLSMSGTPRFAFSVTAAPDINGVNGLGKGQVGGNFGLQATYNVTRKLSVTTGAAYAIKPYEGNFGNYNFNLARWANRDLPSSVYANCKVLDIPINVNYQLYHKGLTAWTVGAGLSSYFMLREDYNFAYNATGTSYAIQINNQNKHIFGVLNLNATYQRQMNSRFGLLIQPYYKLPITQIGYGRVDLRSAGVAVGLSYSISSLRIK